MKKILALVLAVAIVFVFTACAENKDIRGDQTVNGSIVEDNNSASSEAEFSLGSTDGLTYENKFIGLGCELDSGWAFYTDEQIKQLNNVVTDMAGEEYAEAMKNASIVYDMYAVSNNQMDNINVNLEKINAVQLAVLDIAQNFKNVFPTLKQSLENMGYTNISYEVGTLKIGDRDFTSLNTTAQINDINMYQTIIAVKCNGYLANITVTTFNDNNVSDILAKFYTVK